MTRWVLMLGLLLVGCGPSATAVKKKKDQAKYHYDMAYGYYFDTLNPRADLALQEVLSSIENDPANPDSRLLAGLIFLGRQDHLNAIKHFEQAIALKPDFFYAQNNLGVTYLALERWDDAIAIFSKLVGKVLYNRPGHAQNNLGWAWYKKGDLGRAADHFIKAKAVAPKLCPPYNNHAMVLLDQKQPRKALRSADRGLKRCPKYAEAHFNRGRALLALGQPAEAHAAFSACMQFGGESQLAERCEARLRQLPVGGVR